MGHRLSSIVTKTGDDGSTSLDGKERLPKYNPSIALVGELDELNSAVGVAVASLDGFLEVIGLSATIQDKAQSIRTELEYIQHDVFNLGGSLVMKMSLLDKTRCDALEASIAHALEELPPLKEFILPGGTMTAAHLHLARTICRRVERQWWQFYHFVQVNDTKTDSQWMIMAGQYLNRLADWFFVMARVACHMEGKKEVLWKNLSAQKG